MSEDILRTISIVIGRFVILALFFSAWEYASSEKLIDPVLFGKPSGIALYLWTEIFVTGSLLRDLAWTMYGTMAAFVLGSLAGILVGMLFVSNRLVEALFNPILR
jgi:NitT/TauT family transport system permease protein